MQLAHLCQQLTHVARAAAGGRLVGSNRNPIHQVLGKQATQRHQHQANGAVAADKGFHSVVQALGNNVLVHRVKNDDGIIFHAQRGGRVDPVTLPAAFTKLWIDFIGIIAALAGNNDVECLQRLQIKCVLQRARRPCTEGRCWLAKLGRREEDGANGIKVVLFYHALHEYRADHTAPADKTNIFHSVFPAEVGAV